MTNAACSRCGTTDNRHRKKCYEAMILGWALGIEPRSEMSGDQPTNFAVPAAAVVDEITALRAEVDTLTQQLARTREQAAASWAAALAAPEEISSPEPESEPAVQAEPEPEAQRLERETNAALQELAEIREGTRPAPRVYKSRVAEPEPTPEPAAELPEGRESSSEVADGDDAPKPAPVQAQSTRPVRVKTPTAAVEAWLNEEAVASNSDDARIVVATAPEVYAAWAADKPDMPRAISVLTVAKALKGRGYKRRAPLINGRQYPAYYGVRLRTPEPEPDGSIRETRPDEEAAIVERFVTARTRPSSEPDALVPVAEMYGSYQRWCERTGQTDIGRDNFSTCMQQLGAYEKGQLWSGPRKKILGYIGAELTPEPLAGAKPDEVPDNQTIRKAIAAARAAARKVHEEREAAEQAAAKGREAPTRASVKKADEPEKKPDNNGWGKTFNHADAVVSELTVQDILDEHAEIPARGGYQGPRPASGDQLDGETRDLINAILNLDEGWEYQPPQGRQPHSYLRAPDGSRFRQAGTMGGGTGRIGNNRELRRYLRKQGMLPTAGAPVSLLVSASAKPKAPKAKPSEVNVVSGGRSRPLSEHMVQVEAEPDAKPLTEEEMDKALFDLFVDVRGGYDGPFSYRPDVESLQGLDKEAITTAVREPERVEVRPESKAKGYPVIKFARGDVNVIMGFRDRRNPAVIRAEWGWLLGHSQYEVDRHGGGGNKASAGLPNTFGQLAGRLKIAGAEITPNSDGKTAVVSYKGQELGLVTKERCPRATTHSDWNRMQRKIQAIDRRELAAV